ncbi:hypothetical protein GQ457_03G023840 [Hibiscus cannabinus]
MGKLGAPEEDPASLISVADRITVTVTEFSNTTSITDRWRNKEDRALGAPTVESSGWVGIEWCLPLFRVLKFNVDKSAWGKPDSACVVGVLCDVEGSILTLFFGSLVL